MVSLLSNTGELQGHILNEHALCKENIWCLCGCLAGPPGGVCAPLCLWLLGVWGAQDRV